MTYNRTLIFCVPKNLINKALGEQGRNLKKMSEILGTKIKIIPSPRGLMDLKPFIENLVKPVAFKSLEVKGNEVILTAGTQSKAILIGRDKKRLIELQEIVGNYFGKELKII
jgi:transcription antitermination factor NusA-like protein